MNANGKPEMRIQDYELSWYTPICNDYVVCKVLLIHSELQFNFSFNVLSRCWSHK